MAGEAGKKKEEKSGDEKGLNGVVENLAKVVGTLVESSQKQGEQLNQLTGALSNMTETQRQALERSSSKDEDEDEDLSADAVLESMDRKQFMGHMLGQVEKIVSKGMKGLTEQLQTVSSSTEESRLMAELKELQAKHKDFNDFKPEMAKIAQENPELPLTRIYVLAKAENPDKVKELEEKYTKEAEDEEGSEGDKTPASKEKIGFGGLLPTSGGREDVPSDMDSKSASDTAWAETMDGVQLGDD